MRSAGVALAGFMGVGKTTVGKRLAPRLGLPFVDLDEVITMREEAAIPTIFSERGEAGFREAERAALRSVLEGRPAVIALGGGTIHHGDNLELLCARTRVVVLDADWAVIAPRLAGSADRPLAARGRQLWEQRRPGYLAAGRVVDVNGRTADEVVARICEVLA